MPPPPCCKQGPVVQKGGRKARWKADNTSQATAQGLVPTWLEGAAEEQPHTENGRAQRPTWVPPGDKGPGLEKCTSNRETSRAWALYRQLRSLGTQQVAPSEKALGHPVPSPNLLLLSPLLLGQCPHLMKKSTQARGEDLGDGPGGERESEGSHLRALPT